MGRGAAGGGPRVAEPDTAVLDRARERHFRADQRRAFPDRTPERSRPRAPREALRESLPRTRPGWCGHLRLGHRSRRLAPKSGEHGARRWLCKAFLPMVRYSPNYRLHPLAEWRAARSMRDLQGCECSVRLLLQHRAIERLQLVELLLGECLEIGGRLVAGPALAVATPGAAEELRLGAADSHEQQLGHVEQHRQ